jgi:hypothetical protein
MNVSDWARIGLVRARLEAEVFRICRGETICGAVELLAEHGPQRCREVRIQLWPGLLSDRGHWSWAQVVLDSNLLLEPGRTLRRDFTLTIPAGAHLGDSELSLVTQATEFSLAPNPRVPLWVEPERVFQELAAVVTRLTGQEVVEWLAADDRGVNATFLPAPKQRLSTLSGLFLEMYRRGDGVTGSLGIAPKVRGLRDVGRVALFRHLKRIPFQFEPEELAGARGQFERHLRPFLPQLDYPLPADGADLRVSQLPRVIPSSEENV